jgi:Uma2 family endonuclease
MPKQRRLFTAEEYGELPDTDEYHCDLIRGVLGVREPRPEFLHGWIQGKIHYLLFTFAAPRRLGVVATDAGFVLEVNPDTVCAPDVSFVAADHVPPYDTPSYSHGAPDLAVEVLSPSNRKAKIARKIGFYFAAGARLIWCVDPKRRTVTVYRPGREPELLKVGDLLPGDDVLPGFQCAVANVFDPYTL